MYSKWTDVYSQFCAFVAVTIKGKKAKGDCSGVEVLKCMQGIVENDTLLLSVMVCDRLCRSDSARMHHRARQSGNWSKQITMRTQLHREVRKSVNDGNTMPEFRECTAGQLLDDVVEESTEMHRRSRGHSRHMAAWEGAAYPIVRHPTALKYESLRCSTDRPQQVMYWILHSLSDASSMLSIAPPIQSRMYQELSNGMLGYSNVLKIADVPFPFPHAQIMMILLVVWMVFLPIFMMSFTRNWVAGPILAGLLAMATWCMNELAIELEDPFGLDANDLSMQDFHVRFMEGIMEISQTTENMETVYNDEFARTLERVTKSQQVSPKKRMSVLGTSLESVSGTGPLAFSPQAVQEPPQEMKPAKTEQKQAKAQATPASLAIDVQLERIALRMEEHLATIAKQLSVLAEFNRDDLGAARFLAPSNLGRDSGQTAGIQVGVHRDYKSASQLFQAASRGAMHPQENLGSSDDSSIRPQVDILRESLGGYSGTGKVLREKDVQI